jgi:UDP-4-amino-4,6-dideoxy-N-acetyl-beta-L-altrosamine N-acetyltransferase
MLTQHQIGVEEHAAWFAKVSQDPTRHLLIVEEHEEPLGYVQFSNVAVGAVADWGFYARPDAPRGSGRKLGATALNHAFGALQLHKVCGQAIAENTASIALHQKLGFVQEGVLRDHQRIEDAYHSLFCFGLLKREWQVD